MLLLSSVTKKNRRCPRAASCPNARAARDGGAPCGGLACLLACLPLGARRFFCLFGGVSCVCSLFLALLLFCLAAVARGACSGLRGVCLPLACFLLGAGFAGAGVASLGWGGGFRSLAFVARRGAPPCLLGLASAGGLALGLARLFGLCLALPFGSFGRGAGGRASVALGALPSGARGFSGLACFGLSALIRAFGAGGRGFFFCAAKINDITSALSDSCRAEEILLIHSSNVIKPRGGWSAALVIPTLSSVASRALSEHSQPPLSQANVIALDIRFARIPAYALLIRRDVSLSLSERYCRGFVRLCGQEPRENRYRCRCQRPSLGLWHSGVVTFRRARLSWQRLRCRTHSQTERCNSQFNHLRNPQRYRNRTNLRCSDVIKSRGGAAVVLSLV